MPWMLDDIQWYAYIPYMQEQEPIKCCNFWHAPSSELERSSDHVAEDVMLWRWSLMWLVGKAPCKNPPCFFQLSSWELTTVDVENYMSPREIRKCQQTLQQLPTPCIFLVDKLWCDIMNFISCPSVRLIKPRVFLMWFTLNPRLHILATPGLSDCHLVATRITQVTTVMTCPCFIWHRNCSDTTWGRIVGAFRISFVHVGQVSMAIADDKGMLAGFFAAHKARISKMRQEHAADLTLGYMNLWYMGVSKNRGMPKWMVYNGKPY